MSDIPPGWAAALGLLREPPGAGVTPEILASLDRADVLEAVHEFALGHTVLGATLVALERATLRDPTAPACRRLLALLPPLRKRAALWDLERDRIVAGLRRDGVDPVILKGAALRATTYRDPAERDLGDLDILVGKDEVGPAMERLKSLGYSAVSEETTVLYATHHFHYRLVHRSGFRTEVHWDLLPPGGPHRLDPARMLRRSERVGLPGGGDLRVPAAEDMLLHLASQQLEDAMTKLRRLVDIDRLVRSGRVDWESVGRDARSGGLGPVLATSLVLARRLLGTRFPSEILAQVGMTRVTRFHLSLADPVPSMLGQLPQRRAALSRFWEIWLLPSAGDRIRRLTGMLTGRFDAFSHLDPDAIGPPPAPRRAFAVVKLAGYWSWLYVARLAAAVARTEARGRGFWHPGPDAPVLQERDEAATHSTGPASPPS